METAVLEELGFTNAEIKVYLSLLELGSTKAGAVLKHSGLQNSVVHATLNRMVEKGLASFIVHGKVKHYQPTDPRNIVRIIEEKKAQFESLLPQLIAKQALQERQEAEVFEGLRGFKAMCWKLIEDSKPGDDYLFFAFRTDIDDVDEMLFDFYKEFTIDRVRRGLNIKGIAHISAYHRFYARGWDTSNIAFVDFPTVENLSICGNKIIMTPWKERKMAFMITSQQLADTYREYFHSVWDEWVKRRPAIDIMLQQANQ